MIITLEKEEEEEEKAMYTKPLIINGILLIVFFAMAFGLGSFGALLGFLLLCLSMNKILAGDALGRKLLNPDPDTIGFRLGKERTTLWSAANIAIALITLIIVVQMGH